MWYQNPYKWVDETDLVDVHGRLTVRRAIDVLTDTLVERATDTAVMARGVSGAVRAAGLTRHQSDALTLAREAMEAGITPTRYLSEQMGINRFSAYKLLKRVDGRINPKMETSGGIFDMDSKGTRLEEREIQRVLSGVKVECAACGKPGQSARYALCRECMETYGIPGERSERTRKWLDPMISMTRSQARKAAIERLMRVEWREVGE